VSDTDTNALKPCPWCNETPNTDDGRFSDAEPGVWCANFPHCPVEPVARAATLADAIAAWNTCPEQQNTDINAVEREQLKDALILAYTVGAADVHSAWMNDKQSSDPDFTEAAHDYAANALAMLTTSPRQTEGLADLVRESLFHLRLDARAKAYHDRAEAALALLNPGVKP